MPVVQGSCNWLDRYVSSKTAHDSLHKIEVLHLLIFCGHRRVAAIIKATKLYHIIRCDNIPKHEKKWVGRSHKATETELPNA